MAIIGGAGNPVGGSFTGPAEALDIYGDFAAAYSGLVAVSSSGLDMISFTSGNYLFVGTIQGIYPSDDADDMTWELFFNGVVVQKWFNAGATGVANQLRQPPNPLEILIPAYTEVVLKCTATGSTQDMIASIVGRIYRE